MQQALRRDVLQWFVSLDFSFPIKNIKRDLSNGFLVAKILSRYYPHDVQMHSFDYGTKLAKKKDNWDQLRKIFWKENFLVFEDEIESIINCGPHDGVASLLERLYGFLTHKRYKPEDVDIDELWHDIPDTNVLFTNNVIRLSTEDCKFLNSSIDQDAFRTIESSYASTEKALRDLGNDQNGMVEMDLPRREVNGSFKGTSLLASIGFRDQGTNSVFEDQYLAIPTRTKRGFWN